MAVVIRNAIKQFPVPVVSDRSLVTPSIRVPPCPPFWAVPQVCCWRFSVFPVFRKIPGRTIDRPQSSPSKSATSLRDQTFFSSRSGFSRFSFETSKLLAQCYFP